MTPTQLRTRARTIINLMASDKLPQHADFLRSITVTVSDRLTTTAGKAFYARNEVRLSAPILCNPMNEHGVLETVRHEVAHLLSVHLHGPAGRGHGRLWKRTARMVGSTAERCHRLKTARPPRRLCECLDCGQLIPVGPKHQARMLSMPLAHGIQSVCCRSDVELTDQLEAV